MDQIVIAPVRMRRLARCEEDFRELLGEDGCLLPGVSFPVPYQMTLDDLRAALIALTAWDTTVAEFNTNWFLPLSRLDDAFGITDAMTPPADAPGPIGELPVYEWEVFAGIWGLLSDISEDGGDELSDEADFPFIIEQAGFCLARRGKRPEEMPFSHYEMERFLSSFRKDDYVAGATDQDLALARRFIEELIPCGNETALRVKAYACYGGSRLYDCDWCASRDCLLRLRSISDDPQYANTLGYIYYYGRCTGGVPEYEKAFEAFTYAAACGLYEGMYKLADMYRNGYGCVKSPRAACRLYEMVYSDCLSSLPGSLTGNFADAALRMGNAYREGLSVRKDPGLAYMYYMEADLALRARGKDHTYYGDATVATNLARAMAETRQLLPEDYFSEYLSQDRPELFYDLLRGNYRLRVHLSRVAKGYVTLTATRVSPDPSADAKPLLVSYACVNYCDLTLRVTYRAYGFETSLPCDTFVCDYIRKGRKKGQLEFCNDIGPIGWISADEYRFYGKKPTRPRGKKIRFAGVIFQPNGRLYDYICEDTSVRPGDRVIVMGYEGETAVTVVLVHEEFASRLALPLSRYRSIIRKVEQEP